MNKPPVVIRTSDNMPNANIFVDITEDTQLAATLNQIYPEFDASKILLGRTDALGKLTLNAYFKNAVKFYTDANSSDGRFYMEEIASTVASGTNPDIVLALESDLGVNFSNNPSIPLCEGYSSQQSETHAFRATIKNVVNIPMNAPT